MMASDEIQILASQYVESDEGDDALRQWLQGLDLERVPFRQFYAEVGNTLGRFIRAGEPQEGRPFPVTDTPENVAAINRVDRLQRKLDLIEEELRRRAQAPR